MNLGYVKVATSSPEIKVCDVDYNLSLVLAEIDAATKLGVEVLVFPELVLTGATAGDLLCFNSLLTKVEDALLTIVKATENSNILTFVGAPICVGNKVFSSAVAICKGKVLGVVPKGDFDVNLKIEICSQTDVPFSKDILFKNQKLKEMVLGVQIGNDLYNRPIPRGARLVVNTFSEEEYSGADKRRISHLLCLTESLDCAYVLSGAGVGESTTDSVFSGHSLIVEKGQVLTEKKPFDYGLNIADVDLSNTPSKSTRDEDSENAVYFDLDILGESARSYEKTPFIKEGEEEFILDIQAHALVKRIKHTFSKSVVLGLSGGLDSTLALIVCERAMSILGRDKKDIIAVTMPCFGTSSRTFDNSVKLAKAFGVTLKKIDVTKSVTRHLKDLGHPLDLHDAAYENAQARERTQVLMDTANMYGGLVVGTGDLSELALGWATYNGDHMSMYAVNASIPKTLVRHLTEYVAKKSKLKTRTVLLDILDTPVSPELIPSADKKIGQVTEDIVGPYLLHDFFLYNFIKRGFSPTKIYYAAVNTFKGEFDKATIMKWLKTFIRRFFTQQFKRSCMPDGVKATEISLSPRQGFKMPSDAVYKLWLDELEKIEL
ncbi:MAG: NAD(+) synthase [Clostridia bacterium]|nr:NAD(+) synthase [Clostridia bacterium]